MRGDEWEETRNELGQKEPPKKSSGEKSQEVNVILLVQDQTLIAFRSSETMKDPGIMLQQNQKEDVGGGNERVEETKKSQQE